MAGPAGRVWEGGGEAQLAAASNWAEQVSMADQTRMQCGSKAAKPATGWRQRGGVKQAGGRARDWSHSSRHSLFVLEVEVEVVGGWGGGCRKSQLSPLDKSTGTTPCVC